MKTTKLHKDLQTPSFNHLFKGVKQKKSLIGKKVKFANWEPSMGSLAKTEIWKVGSLQRDYKGDICMRVYATSFKDTFGRCMGFDEAKFVK
jgi:hypothetical protein